MTVLAGTSSPLSTPAVSRNGVKRNGCRALRRHPTLAPHPANPDEEVAALIHRPQRTPDAVVEQYPAHLHIDLLPRLQGKGVGRALMERLPDALDQRKVTGVHLDVAPGNRRAIGFYQRLGFSRLTGHRGGVFMGLRLAEVGHSATG